LIGRAGGEARVRLSVEGHRAWILPAGRSYPLAAAAAPARAGFAIGAHLGSGLMNSLVEGGVLR